MSQTSVQWNNMTNTCIFVVLVIVILPPTDIGDDKLVTS